MKAAARAAFNQRGSEIAAELEKYAIPEKQLDHVAAFAVKLLAGNPQMKNDRVIRKTVEQYKLKLREDESTDQANANQN